MDKGNHGSVKKDMTINLSNEYFLKILASCLKFCYPLKCFIVGFINVKGCDNKIGGLVILIKGYENIEIIEIVKVVFGKECG